MYQNHDFQQSVGAAEYEFRSAERLTIPLDATLRTETGEEFAVRLRDISSLGFMMECEDIVPIGSRVELLLAPLEPLAAEVRWGLAGWIGCRFHNELGWDKLFLKLIGRGAELA
ncbi:MAG TPA: PilZ domain-containing protein [Allosphingosinicella sp.]|uniref:PilZ domain-containing protein n=1 Tax=Allosphingosinicella sp. TaxID=2823234 RepID=UPI002EDB5B2D